MIAPSGVRHAWWTGAPRRLEGPEAAFLRSNRAFRELGQPSISLWVRSSVSHFFKSIERGSGFDPTPQRLDLSLRELLSGRHAWLLLVGDILVEPARARIGRHHDR